MKQFILAYAIAVPLFLAVDMIWLLGPGRPYYVSELGGLLKASPNLWAAGAFYLLYSVGLVSFAIVGGVQNTNAYHSLAYGALFGLVAYATYDLTSLSVVDGFTTKIALIDMAWGTILSAAVSWGVTRICIAIL